MIVKDPAPRRFQSLPLEQLVPLSPVASRLLQLPLGRDTPFHVYAEIIGRDPGFSAQVLSMANSPLLGLRSPVTSILQALCILGQDRLNALVAMLGFYKLVHQRRSADIFRPYWRNSVATAVLTERLATQINDVKGCEYACGLLHNIGALVFLREDPALYEEILKAESVDQMLQREREEFTVDHCTLGARLVSVWGLPHPFVEAARDHHGEPTGSAGILARASRIAAHAGFAFGPVQMSTEPETDAARSGELIGDLAERINAIECSLGM